MEIKWDGVDDVREYTWEDHEVELVYVMMFVAQEFILILGKAQL